MSKPANYLTEIGSLYGSMLDKVVVEKTSKQNTFPQAKDKTPKVSQDKKTDKKAFVHKDSGPGAAETLQKPETSAKFSAALEKTETRTINNSMSKRFDDLYKNVIQNKLQLEADDIETIDDVTAAPELHGGESGPEAEGEHLEDDLTAEELLAKAAEYIAKAQDKLSGASQEELGEMEGEGEGEEAGAEDNETQVGEGQAIWNVSNPVDASGKIIDTTKSTDLAGDAKKYINSKGTANQVGDTTKKLAKTKKADWNVNNPVDGSGKDIGHPLVGAGVTGAASKLQNTKGRANVVAASKFPKEGQSIG